MVIALHKNARTTPAILFAVAFTRRRGSTGEGPRPPLLPWFMIAFALRVAINSTGWLAPLVAKIGSDISTWFLVASMAGIGMKTHLRELVTLVLKPVVLMVGETVLLALLVLAMLRWMH